MSIDDKIFQDSYKETLAMLELKSKAEFFEIEAIKGQLDTLYIHEGLDWTGRGSVKNSEISGTIAAYQIFIHNYLKK